MTFSKSAKVIGLGVAVALCIAAAPAHAGPFVDIRSFWSAQLDPQTMPPPGFAPAGFSVSCFGGASSSIGGCFADLALQQTITAPGTYSAQRSGGLTITNTTQGSLSGYAAFIGGYSAFNPGGPGEGIGIDNPLTQWATFSSSVSSAFFADHHSCAVGFRGNSGAAYSATTCGVVLPDASQGAFAIDLSTIPAMSSIDILFTLAIDTEFVFADAPVGVPEPGSAALLLAGLGAMVVLRRKRERADGSIRQSTR